MSQYFWSVIQYFVTIYKFYNIPLNNFLINTLRSLEPFSDPEAMSQVIILISLISRIFNVPKTLLYEPISMSICHQYNGLE